MSEESHLTHALIATSFFPLAPLFSPRLSFTFSPHALKFCLHIRQHTANLNRQMMVMAWLFLEVLGIVCALTHLDMPLFNLWTMATVWDITGGTMGGETGGELNRPTKSRTDQIFTPFVVRDIWPILR
jgi:hypothetical protein